MTASYGGKLALIVGGSEGIGRSVAIMLARAGSDVVVLSRNSAKLSSALADLQRAKVREDQRIGVEVADVTNYEGTRTVIDTVVADLGTPDFVMTFAGFARPGWIDHQDIRHAHAMVNTNLLGTINVCHAAVPHLVSAGRGSILTTSSMAGLVGVFGYTSYCASKFGVRGFSESLRREMRPLGIGVSMLCPPNTRTPGFEEENRHKPAEVLAAEESVRTLDPDDVARVVLDRLPGNPFLIIPVIDGRMAERLNRYLPAVVDRVLRRPPLH